MKITVLMCGNQDSLPLRNKIQDFLIKYSCHPKEFGYSSNYILNCQQMALELRFDNKNRIGIVFCNVGNSMHEVTKDIYGIKNLIVTKEIKNVKTQFETASMITIGIQEYDEEEIFKIVKFYVDNAVSHRSQKDE